MYEECGKSAEDCGDAPQIQGICIRAADAAENTGRTGVHVQYFLCSLSLGNGKIRGNNEYNLVISNKQTNGRGRLGKSFYSPEDTGIYMSFVYKNNKLSNPINITSIAAVAVTNAITEIMDIDINIKWVNDLYYNNKKICGILTEATTNPDTGELDNIIVGIGLNISTTSFPNELKEIATSINLESSRKYELIARIVNNLHYFLNNDYYHFHGRGACRCLKLQHALSL